MNQCAECQKDTINPKFCCMSCAATFNNKIYKKRSKELKSICKQCGKPCPKKRKFCNECYQMRDIVLKDLTLKEASYKDGHTCNANGLIRNRARNYALKVLGWTKCEKCGYDKHIEIAHKKPICEFDENTLLSEINHKDNLMALCPNCHWEYDHPILEKIFKERSIDNVIEVKSNYCSDCQTKISLQAKRCRACYVKKVDKPKKIKWPAVEYLLEKLQSQSYRSLGNELGVSGNAIRKHIELELTKNTG